MKVVLVSTDFLPNIGGVAQHVAELGRALQAAGHIVEVIAPKCTHHWASLKTAPFAESLNGLSVWRIPTVLNTSIKFVTGQISSRLSDGRFVRDLLSRLGEVSPDVVHWHALESRIHPLSGWTKTAKVWTNHTSYFITGIAAAQRSYYHVEADMADQIIAPSEELCDLTASLGVPREKIHFISNGVDSQRFRPDINSSVWSERLSLTDGERLVLCPRRLEKKNGVRYFVEAAVSLLRNGLNGTRFAIAGDFSGPRGDSDVDTVADLITRSGFAENFITLGRIENAEMPGLYARADVVVMPSLMEATSLSAMEAMATAKPLVSTNVGGLPFLVREGENGHLVAPHSTDQLASAIQALLDRPDRRAAFGRNGRKRVEAELDWIAIAGQTVEVYETAIKRHRGRDKSAAVLTR